MQNDVYNSGTLCQPVPTWYSHAHSRQPVFNKDMLNGGTRSLLELRLSPTSYWQTNSLFLSFISSTGLPPPWLRAPIPLPASFLGEPEPGPSTCSGSASVSINSPGKQVATLRFLLSKLHPLPESSGCNGSPSLYINVLKPETSKTLILQLGQSFQGPQVSAYAPEFPCSKLESLQVCQLETQFMTIHSLAQFPL